LRHFVLILSLIFLLAGCSSVIPSNSGEITATANSTVQSIDPYSFEVTYNESGKAGEPIIISYTIKNNTDTPIIAISLAFEDYSMIQGVKVSTYDNWTFYQADNTNTPRINISNIFLKKNESISSKFSLMFTNPGTYQFKLQPQIKAGDNIKLKTAIISLKVVDSDSAKLSRDSASKIDIDKKRIAEIDKTISKLNIEIGVDKSEISNQNSQIEWTQGNIRHSQENLARYPKDAATYNQEIQDYNNEISQRKAKISELQAEINKYNDQIKLLNEEKTNLSQEIANLEKNL